jgi:hypothetical protein
MKPFQTKSALAFALAAFLGTVLAPGAWACACGCGIFEVGTGALYPTGTGGKVSVEVDYMDQNQNWSGTSAAPASANGDKEIVTEFYKLSGEYMINHSWGVQAEIPYWNRNFTTDPTFGQTPDNGNVTMNETALGDVRLMGMYTGFSKDMSTGLLFGVKLPTGNDTYFGNVDTEIGTGSTDLLLGIYHFGALFGDSAWNWTGELRMDVPFLFSNGYYPGAEFDGSLGINYKGFSLGDLTIVPLAQVEASYRLQDQPGTGDPATQNVGDPANSGYERIALAPGLDLEYNSWRLFATVGVPVFANVNGNQLVAPVLLKALVSFSF